MTVRVRTYRDMEGYRNNPEVGFFALHIDFINNREEDGIKVTWVNGADDPDNTPAPPKRSVTERELLDELADERGVRIA